MKSNPFFTKGLPFYISLFVLLFAFGCAKEELPNATNAIEDIAPEQVTLSDAEQAAIEKIEATDGLLQFQDREHFELVLKAIDSKPTVLAELKDQFGFYPLSDLMEAEYEQLKANPEADHSTARYWHVEGLGNQKLIKTNYPFIQFAQLLNDQEAVRIGEMIIKYAEDRVYSIQAVQRPILDRIDALNLSPGSHANIFVSAVVQQKDAIAQRGVEGVCRNFEVSDNIALVLYGEVVSSQWTEQVGDNYWIHYADSKVNVYKATIDQFLVQAYNKGSAGTNGTITTLFTSLRTSDFSIYPMKKTAVSGIWSETVHAIGIQTQSPTPPTYQVWGNCTVSGDFIDGNYENLSCSFDF